LRLRAVSQIRRGERATIPRRQPIFAARAPRFYAVLATPKHHDFKAVSNFAATNRVFEISTKNRP
jgi:hypothetical protein